MSKRPTIKGRGVDIYLGGDATEAAKPARTKSAVPATRKPAAIAAASGVDAGDESLCGFERLRKAAAWYIETNAQLVRQAIELQEKNAEWAAGTVFAPFFEAQASSARALLEGSTATARNLWRIRNAN